MFHAASRRKNSIRRSPKPHSYGDPEPLVTPHAHLMRQHLDAAPDRQSTFLNDPNVSPQIRRSIAQQIGQTHGNQYLRRLYEPTLQREAAPMLRLGSRGESVKSLQKALMDCGAAISDDGIFGPKTRIAVISFQQAAGLAPDGIVGPQTWAKLQNGGIKIPATGGSDPAANQLVLAKLQEVKTLMKKLGSSPTAAAGNAAPQAATTVTIPHVHPAADDANGEEKSWWDEAKDAAGSVVNDVSEAAGNAWDSTKDAASDAWDTTKNAASSVANDIGEAAGEVWNGVKGAAGAAGDIVGGMVDDAKGKVGEIVQGVQQTVNSGIDTVVHGVSEIASDVGKSIEEFGSEISQKYADEIAAVKEFFNDVKHYLNNPEDALRKLDEILNGLKKKAVELFGGDEDDAPDTLRGTVPDVESTAAPIECHDSPAPGKRTLKLAPSFESATQTRQETPIEGPFNYDSLRPTLSHVSVVTSGDSNIVQVPSNEFGTTGGKIKIEKTGFEAAHFTNFVKVSARLTHQVSWDITNRPGRLDTNDPELKEITEENWTQAADDLDPDIHKTELGAPARKKFWASDITKGHEEFHANETEKYVRDVVVPAIESEMANKDITVDWFIWRDTNIEEQLHEIMVEMVKKATAMKNAHMAKPMSEHRAYAADAPKYRARAMDIRRKGFSKGWKPSEEKKP